MSKVLNTKRRKSLGSCCALHTLNADRLFYAVPVYVYCRSAPHPLHNVVKAAMHDRQMLPWMQGIHPRNRFSAFSVLSLKSEIRLESMVAIVENDAS